MQAQITKKPNKYCVMKKNLIFYFLFLFCCFNILKAEEVELNIHIDVPGSLSDKIFSENIRPLHVTKLTLTGTLNDEDFTLMRETMISLHTVDISAITNTTGVIFNDHTNIRNINLPQNLNSLANNAFSNCTSLNEINIPKSLTKIGSAAFQSCTSLKSIFIPNTITKIEAYTFNNCTSLESINLSNNITEIGEDAFRNCSSLKYITIPNKITEVKAYTFSNCKSLESIILHNNITKIGTEAFASCSKIKTFTIPASITTIEDNILKDCSNIDTIICLNNTPPQTNELGINELECILVVPIKAYNEYIRHAYWGKFFTIETTDINYITINTAVNNETMGYVIGSGYHKVGTEIEIEAIPYEDYLFFKWSDNNTDNPRKILITDSVEQEYQAIFYLDTLSCKPVDIKITHTNSNILIKWQGNAEEYEIRYFSNNDTNTIKTTEKYLYLSNLETTVYTLQIRGLCENDTSNWKINQFRYYDKTGLIIDYLNLEQPNVTCEIGYAKDPSNGKNSTFEPTSPIDYGSASELSRHTTHWDKNEFDPRTGNKLRTIPENAIASVRLGNWSAGSEAEAITYEHIVNKTHPILIIRYAIVLESPGHGPIEDPYFKIEILDENGNIINSRCGAFDFTPTNEPETWCTYLPSLGVQYVWKDWSSTSIDLTEYAGQTIKIRFETQDCLRQAHSGYAYFTLDFIKSIITPYCDNHVIVDTTTTFTAPAGFRYTWWSKEENGNEIISTNQSITVEETDTFTYYCNVQNIHNECGFTLKANASAQIPYADFKWKWAPENCENKIILTNKSRILRYDGSSSNLPCESTYWNINNGEIENNEENIIVNMPNEGGELNVNLSVSMNNDACIDDTIMTIIVPPIYSHEDTIYDTICHGDFVRFGDMFIAASGTYTDSLRNIFGCDSITTLNLTVLPYLGVKDTTITLPHGGGEVILEGETFFYDRPGIYTESVKTEDGCIDIHIRVQIETALNNTDYTPLIITPNPTNTTQQTIINKEWSIDEMTNLKVEIINTLGQIIETYTPKTYPISIPQQNTPGTYYIKITTGIGTTHIGKLIVI